MARRFSWVEAKRQNVIRSRGIDLLRVKRIFDNPDDLLIRLDNRRDYGEYRYQAVGRIDDDFYFLVYAKRDGVRHLITGWRLDEAGRRRYQNRNRRRN
ncbi:MAG: hypothetical protein GVY13_15600 [Alphaproteobacteria bacterium]|jgi:uncharacterized DUF497 family protein|nr:hypothetical protein [Alphaproteobacteria bacterium]